MENELRSWIPRRPSAKIARRLFGPAAPAPSFLRRVDLWHCLTPAAACILALMVVAHGADKRLARMSVPDNATFFATLMFNAASSNSPQTVMLSQLDENVEWNVWPHPFRLAASAAAAPRSGLNIWSVIPTNR